MKDNIRNIYLAFNALDSLEDQHEVVDTLYDALFKSNLRQVLANRIVRTTKQELKDANQRIGELLSEIDRLEDLLDTLRSKRQVKPNQYYESLSEDEKKHFREEVYEDVFIKQLRTENERLRTELKNIHKYIDHSSISCQS